MVSYKVKFKSKETILDEKKIVLNFYKLNKFYAEVAAVIKRSRYTVRGLIKKY